MDGRRALLILNEVPGLGCRILRQLLETYGSPLDLLTPSVWSDLGRKGEQGAKWAESIRDTATAFNVDPILQQADRSGVQIYTVLDSDYPVNLKAISDPPIVLYVKGGLIPEDRVAISVVGSRHPSLYGREQAYRIASDLARSGVTVVSGLARGIDTQAHIGALRAGGRTLAVLGCGIDVIYPPENQKYYEEIAANGAVVSEFGFGVEPRPGHFPRRNRIISGLGLGVLVVEAHCQSGSLITARYAMEEGREVYALPGQVTSLVSQGTHQLIKQGAKLVEGADDILFDLQDVLRGLLPKTSPVEKEIPSPVSDSEEKILMLLRTRSLPFDEVVEQTQLQPAEVANALVTLEVKRFVKKLYGGMFEANEVK